MQPAADYTVQYVSEAAPSGVARRAGSVFDIQLTSQLSLRLFYFYSVLTTNLEHRDRLKARKPALTNPSLQPRHRIDQLPALCIILSLILRQSCWPQEEK